VNKRHNNENHSFNGEIDEERLLSYIDGSMPAGEQHQLEELLETDPFLSDAIEGLSEVRDKAQLKAIAAQINTQLSRQIQNRRKQRRSRPKLTDHWGWLFVVIILLLMLVSWWVIRVMLK